jgi:hypothetical protein
VGLMRKMARRSVRRVTPRPVRQVNRVVRHPVRTSVRAVTPRPIRQAQRSVFNVTHPVNTAENALLNSLSGSRGRATRSASPSAPSRPSTPASQPSRSASPSAPSRPSTPPSQPVVQRQMELPVDPLAHADEDVRYEAVRGLEGRGSSESREPLLQATKDREGMVRKVAVRGVARLNDPRDTDLFVGALGDADEDVRYEAIHALEDRLSPELREPLRLATQDGDRFVRRIAFRAVGRLNDSRDTGMLVYALRDTDEDVRYEVIHALEDRLSPELREPLLRAAKDSAADVRGVAVRALSVLAEREAEGEAHGGSTSSAPEPPEVEEITPLNASEPSDHDPADLVLAVQVSANHGMLEMTVRELLAVLDRERLTQAALDDLDHTLYDAGLDSDPRVDDLDLNGSVRLTRHEVIPEFELRVHVDHSGPWTLPVVDLLRAFDRAKLTDRARADIADALQYSGLTCQPPVQSVGHDDSITLSRAQQPG